MIKDAIILAAGMGTRLHPFTATLPKALVPVGGRPMLLNCLQQLRDAGVRRTTIVVGHRASQIVDACQSSGIDIELRFIESDAYRTTGTAYSLWLARQTLKEDAFLLEADVMYSKGMLSRLLSSNAPACLAALAPFGPRMSGTAVELSPEGRIRQFFKGRTYETARGLYKTINIFLLRAEIVATGLMPNLTRFINEGNTKAYLEDVLSSAVEAEHLAMTGIDCGDLPWWEVDDAADLEHAEDIFADRAR